ncbi:MAG: hypothetical protein H0X36_10350 [Sphingomonadaceae bacterium]|nr:hypothetical protein [Sphingomonadaceae bacterium]
MPDSDLPPDPSELRRRVLSRWDNEGGAIASAHGTHMDVPDLTNAELVQLRIRVIALENLLIAVLAEGSDRQCQVARDMAEYISPRPGFTHHPLTIQAADHMSDLVDRAVHFRIVHP